MSVMSTVGKKVLRGLLSLLVMAVIAGGYFAYKYFSGDADLAKVGDCMVGENDNDIKTVDCTDGKAKWKVVGRLDGGSNSASVEVDCKAYPTAEAVVYTTGGRRSSGYRLCLEEIKK